MHNPSFIFSNSSNQTINEIIRNRGIFKKITYVHTLSDSWMQRYRPVTFENPAQHKSNKSFGARSIHPIDQSMARGNATSNFHEIYLHGTPIVRCATGEPRFHSLTREYDTHIHTYIHIYTHIYTYIYIHTYITREREREKGG